MAKLLGLHALVTQSQDFMGPALCRHFAAEGAAVTAIEAVPRHWSDVERHAAETGPVDILLLNLMKRNSRKAVVDLDEEDWRAAFDVMVTPLHWYVRAYLPRMLERRSGRIIVMGSANGLKGSAPRSGYSAARGAQLTYVKSLGIEVARSGVTVNAIAQNYISNPTSYNEEILRSADFAERLREVPAGRIGASEDVTSLAVFLATEEGAFFHGQIFPVSGGWAT